MDEIDAFFASFPTFQYRRHASSPQEFRRMCQFFGWRKDSNDMYPVERQEASANFRVAMVRTFNQKFGQGVEVKRAWLFLCTVIGVEPMPNTIEDMKGVSQAVQSAMEDYKPQTQTNASQAVLDTHINSSDLLDSVRTGSPVRIFATHADLVNYTRSQGRYFPKEDAYAGGLLKYLLREIDNTYHGRRGKKLSRGKKRDISCGDERA
jgi:hypothetical protein